MKKLIIKQKNSKWLSLHFSYNKRFVTALQSIKPLSYRKFNKKLGSWEIHESKLSLVIQFSQKHFSEVEYDTLPPNLKLVIEIVLKDFKTSFKAPKVVDAYETLFILRSAPKEVIKASYKALVMVHHPDHGGDAEMFRRVQEAYNELKG